MLPILKEEENDTHKLSFLCVLFMAAMLECSGSVAFVLLLYMSRHLLVFLLSMIVGLKHLEGQTDAQVLLFNQHF